MQHFLELKQVYQTSFDAYRKMRKQVLEVKKNQQEHKSRIEMLEFQMAEIEAANLRLEKTWLSIKSEINSLTIKILQIR